MATRNQVTKRTYVDKTGEHSRFPSADTVAVNIHFVEAAEDMVMVLSKMPKQTLMAAAAYGIATSIGNAIGGQDTVDEMIEAADARFEVLCEGKWTTDRVSGPRSSDLMEAVAKAKAEAGFEIDRDTFYEKLKSGEVTSKDLLAMAPVRKHYDAIKAERAQARAAQSAKQSRSSEADHSAALGAL